MGERFLRNLILASFLFLVVIIVAYMSGDVSQSIEEYVVFVISTNFSIEPTFWETGFFRDLTDWNLPSFFEAWPKANSGR